MSALLVHFMVYIYELGSITADSGARASRPHYACAMPFFDVLSQSPNPAALWDFSTLGKRFGCLET
jgi:hypothetical protein